jgi:uncharacterized membrane protein
LKVIAPANQRRVAVLSVAALLAWIALWLGVYAGPAAIPGWVPVLVMWLPLFPTLPLLWRGRRGACAWGSMIGVFYAGFAVVELTANPAERVWAAGALALSLAMVFVLVRCARHWPASQAGTG